MVIEKGYPLPLYITVKEDMTDEELFELCAANKHLRIERDENNQLIIMSPTGGKTSRKHVKILSALDQWNNENKGG